MVMIDTKAIGKRIQALRRAAGMTQEQAAETLGISPNYVSNIETGRDICSTVVLLGSPRTLVCQSCGMPLNDDILAKNTDGSFNEQYCMWCWDGEGFAQDCTMEEMVEHCLPHMPLGRTDPEACRAYMRSLLPTLGRWKEN